MMADQDEVARLLDEAPPSWDPKMTLDDLVGEWSSLIEAIERGYSLSIWDYTNDLSIRDRLDRIILQATPALSREIQEKVAPFDERFVLGTEEAETPLDAETARFWWRRVPKLQHGNSGRIWWLRGTSNAESTPQSGPRALALGGPGPMTCLGCR